MLTTESPGRGLPVGEELMTLQTETFLPFPRQISSLKFQTFHIMFSLVLIMDKATILFLDERLNILATWYHILFQRLICFERLIKFCSSINSLPNDKFLTDTN